MDMYLTSILASACPMGQCGLLPVILFAAVIWGGYNLWQYLKTKNVKGLYFIRVFLIVIGVLFFLVYFRRNLVTQSYKDGDFTPVVILDDDGERLGLPLLVSLGAATCLPCRKMEPVREKLREDYKGRMLIEYHDVSKNPATGHKFGVRSIPTVIFVGADGKELTRHVGYMSEQDIINTWRKQGIDLDAAEKQEREDSNDE